MKKRNCSIVNRLRFKLEYVCAGYFNGSIPFWTAYRLYKYYKKQIKNNGGNRQ